MSNTKVSILMVRSQSDIHYMVVRIMDDEVQVPCYEVFKVEGQEIIPVSSDEEMNLIYELEAHKEGVKGNTIRCTIH